MIVANELALVAFTKELPRGLVAPPHNYRGCWMNGSGVFFV